MKRSPSSGYLEYLFVATVLSLFLLVMYTFATGISPLEAAGISPAAGTIGFGFLLLFLLALPLIIRKLRRQA